MAVDMFLKIDSIAGESTDSVHKGDIQVLAYSWGAKAPVDAATGLATGKSKFAPLTVTKYQDSSSTFLFTAIATGTKFKQAVLANRKPGGTAPLDFLTITLTNVNVLELTLNGGGGDERLTEQVQLNYSKIEFQYKQQNAAGAIAATFKAGFDITTHAAV
jgi:type VI secretion system secreted protein Hcp